MPKLKRVILLTGAPERDTLDWSEGGLISCFTIPTKRHPGASTIDSTALTPNSRFAKWRALHIGQDALQKQYHDDAPQTQFLCMEQNGGSKEDHECFLAHSLAILEDLESSQLALADDSTIVSASFNSTVTGSSLSTTHTGSPTGFPGSRLQRELRQPPGSLHGNITDLKAVPNATHLLRINPQTITIDILVGIISVGQPRTVHLRKRNVDMEIVELVVGDDTRAGFGVSIWLAPQESHRRPSDDLRHNVIQLRTGDVVMMHNIALSVFRGCVYGQSLSKRFSRNSTVITRLDVDEVADGLPAPSRGKITRVIGWLDDFVGRPGKVMDVRTQPTRKSGREPDEEELPPDSQD